MQHPHHEEAQLPMQPTEAIAYLDGGSDHGLLGVADHVPIKSADNLLDSDEGTPAEAIAYSIVIVAAYWKSAVIVRSPPMPRIEFVPAPTLAYIQLSD